MRAPFELWVEPYSKDSNALTRLLCRAPNVYARLEVVSPARCSEMDQLVFVRGEGYAMLKRQVLALLMSLLQPSAVLLCGCAIR